jgi:hypothetical protein
VPTAARMETAAAAVSAGAAQAGAAARAVLAMVAEAATAVTSTRCRGVMSTRPCLSKMRACPLVPTAADKHLSPHLCGRWQGSTSSTVVVSTTTSRTRPLLLLLPLSPSAALSTLRLIAVRIRMQSASGLHQGARDGQGQGCLSCIQPRHLIIERCQVAGRSAGECTPRRTQ